MPIKYYPAMEKARDWLFAHERAKWMKRLAIWCHERCIENKVEYHHISYDQFCDMLRHSPDGDLPETRTRNSSIFTLPGGIGKAEVVQGVDKYNYSVRFIKNRAAFMTEKEVEELDD